jgi:hypothetical protein
MVKKTTMLMAALCATNVYSAPAVGNANMSHLSKRAGWDYWSGGQFGAWIGLGSGMGWYAKDLPQDGYERYVLGGGAVVCYLIAIAGGKGVGSAPESRKRSHHGYNGTYIPPLSELQDFPMDSVLKRQSSALSWKILDENDKTIDVIAFDGVWTHVSSIVIPEGHSTRNTTKRNETKWYNSLEGSDRIYGRLLGGNSAREYYYDTSKADWQEYFRGLTYWKVNNNHDSKFEQLCMIPQDSQGNAVAAISVVPNSGLSGFDSRCYSEALDANPTFQVSK